MPKSGCRIKGRIVYGGFIGTERARVLFRRGMINKSENKCQVGGKKRLGEMK